MGGGSRGKEAKVKKSRAPHQLLPVAIVPTQASPERKLLFPREYGRGSDRRANIFRKKRCTFIRKIFIKCPPCCPVLTMTTQAYYPKEVPILFCKYFHKDENTGKVNIYYPR